MMSDVASTHMRWRALQAVGTFSFETVGVVYSLSKPLTEAGLHVFYLSTFRTGFVLLPEEDLLQGLSALHSDWEIEQLDNLSSSSSSS